MEMVCTVGSTVGLVVDPCDVDPDVNAEEALESNVGVDRDGAGNVHPAWGSHMATW